MKTLLAALAATVALAGAASAQEAPQLVGNYSENVLQEYNDQYNGNSTVASSNGVDFTSTAAIARRPNVDRPASGGYGPTVSAFDIYTGR